MLETMKHAAKVLIGKRANCSPLFGERLKEVQQTITHVRKTANTRTTGS